MAVEFIAHGAPPLACASASGTRSIAQRLACGRQAPDGALIAAAREIVAPTGAAGRVQSGGTFRDASVTAQIAQALGPALAPALRETLEWYVCRGAHFHNDAHYGEVMFGVWCVVGPPADLVFPRAGLRLAAGPGCFAVFDPFEVHGELAPSCERYAADDYADASPSVFVGFELELPPVRQAFGIGRFIDERSDARVISSQTRIDAASGALSQ
jgi:hypothetical protein